MLLEINSVCMLVGFMRTVLNVLATCKRRQALCCLFIINKRAKCIFLVLTQFYIHV